MRLIDHITGPVTLDNLMAEASGLGRVEISHMGGQHVEIMFYTPAKSLVYARGYHTDLFEAFRIAINEARRMKE